MRVQVLSPALFNQRRDFRAFLAHGRRIGILPCGPKPKISSSKVIRVGLAR
jgi:hypothetical protein